MSFNVSRPRSLQKLMLNIGGLNVWKLLHALTTLSLWRGDAEKITRAQLCFLNTHHDWFFCSGLSEFNKIKWISTVHSTLFIFFFAFSSSHCTIVYYHLAVHTVQAFTHNTITCNYNWVKTDGVYFKLRTLYYCCANF